VSLICTTRALRTRISDLSRWSEQPDWINNNMARNPAQARSRVDTALRAAHLQPGSNKRASKQGDREQAAITFFLFIF
jgi:hypothetical protein